jgi:drug/metabolite transporter (DMT)-like permease
VLAALALGERPSPLQWICILIGFVGVVIVLNPRDLVGGGALVYPLAMAFSNALLYVLTRYGGRQDGPLTLVFWASLTALLICLAGLPFYAVPIPMSAYLLLIAGGTFGTLGHLMIAAAFRRAPTAVVSPLLYSQIVWATLIGWFVFGEVPTLQVAVGSAVVIASGVAVLRMGAPDRR